MGVRCLAFQAAAVGDGLGLVRISTGASLGGIQWQVRASEISSVDVRSPSGVRRPEFEWKQGTEEA